jgi:hypothetical protein
MKIARFLLFAAVATLPCSIVINAQSTPGCGEGSTLKDTYSAADTKRAEDFLLTLKSAVQANDKAKVSTMVKYPVRVNLPNGTHRVIRTPQQFRAQYDFLFDQNTRDAIHTQVPQCMFARDQGAMIGNGQIWFQDFNGTFRIWSFNHME